ncbi:MAG: nicotinamide riboside transporter PnuC [Actinomycetia bacterium]|nr:nicotinamide riboside transporter PnuC [Actinomycetes bacterium]MCH9701941.1 nicotinamide riboside transporter PnuC [Actinomycetes bacterium]MCH9759197.1 nicotinamide riboside transporter PnuC [Actinomycetes bacterium]
MSVLFTLWGYGVTVIESLSVIAAVLGVSLSIVGTRWAWPFYFVSSLLYGWLFIQVNLFASASMQLIFVAAAIWGWFSWGREGVRTPGRLTAVQRGVGAIGCLVLWSLVAPLLNAVGGAASFGDAFMVVGSLAAQILMVGQKIETWPVWIAVNTVGAVLYATQALYFTSLFYGVLILMAVTGWRAWRSRVTGHDVASPAPVHG